VGVPLRDFAVTPGVPALAPSAADLVSKDFYYTPKSDPSSVDPTKDDTKRYLYGIDQRDGSVMVFDLALNGGVPVLTPLLAPAPARDVLRRFSNFGDRIGVGGDGAFTARALGVLDTRQQLLPTGAPDDFFCGQYDDNYIEDEKNKAADTATKQLWTYHDEVLDTASDDRAYRALRGVFLLITGSSGVVAVIDVHNLDLQCRARANCDETDTDKLGSGSQARGVALQRHAVRLSGIEPTSANLSSGEDLVGEDEGFRFGLEPEADGGEPEPDAETEPPVDGGAPPLDAGGEPADGGEEPGAGEAGGEAPPLGDGEFLLNEENCPIGYYRIENSSAFICAAANPWRSRPASWTSTYRGSLTLGIAFSAALEEGENEGEILMQAPQGLDFCERGVEQEGFAVVIGSEPEDDTPEFCDRDADDPWRLLIKQAYQDHLVLEMAEEVEGPSGQLATLEDLRTCFGEFSDFQVRLADAWRVQVSDSAYLHRVMTGEDGACVIDPQIDRRWQARTDPSFPYVDSYIAFQLRQPTSDTADAKETINPTITLDLEATPLTMQFTSGPRFDTLPVRVRSFPRAGYLFVVDAASQGITSFWTFPELEVDESYH
jgi:hypothetical protein